MHQIIEYIVGIVGDLGYIGIFIMMVLESSFFPFPSEVAMIPAGYLSSTGEMNFVIALVIGTIGALIGASINYLLGYKLGGPAIITIINKYGKYLFIKEEYYTRSEKYFVKHGVITTFLARFITVVRQLISFPAGVFKMNFGKFLFFTGLGAGIWNLILMIIGYIAGENKELIAEYTKELLIGGILFVSFIFVGYLINNKIIKSKNLKK
ncbi:MAG: DedA family protein [Candidatus Gracilibacteria bacterium]|nr:DedA family protein [Candidatus Gracilibacteria bacterium]